MLEVVIPTFNRPAQLRQTVQSLLPQMTAETSIALIDNASEPPVTFESLGITGADARGKIRILRNNVNIGADANILRCFEICAAPYLWLLGDDDVLDGSAIQIILDDIRNTPDAIFFSYVYRSHRALSRKTSGLAGFIHGIDVWHDVMFISNNIYNCAQVRKAVQSGYHYCYAYSGQVAVLLDSLRRCQGHVLFSHQSIIKGNIQTENMPCWSILRYSLSRFALLDMEMDDELRVVLGRKMLSGAGTLNHVFVYCLVLSTQNQAGEARFYFNQIVQRTRRYANAGFTLKALFLGLLLHFPHTILSLIRIFDKSDRFSAVMKRENSAKETI